MSKSMGRGFCVSCYLFLWLCRAAFAFGVGLARRGGGAVSAVVGVAVVERGWGGGPSCGLGGGCESAWRPR